MCALDSCVYVVQCSVVQCVFGMAESRIYTHTHTHSSLPLNHTYLHILTHKYTCADTTTHERTPTCVCTTSYIRGCTYTCTHAYIQLYTYSHIDTYEPSSGAVLGTRIAYRHYVCTHRWTPPHVRSAAGPTLTQPPSTPHRIASHYTTPHLITPLTYSCFLSLGTRCTHTAVQCMREYIANKCVWCACRSCTTHAHTHSHIGVCLAWS